MGRLVCVCVCGGRCVGVVVCRTGPDEGTSQARGVPGWSVVDRGGGG